MKTRRDFIKGALSAGTVLFGGSFLLSRCKNAKKKLPASCSDLSGVSQEEKEKRKKLGYVAETPITESKCSVCKLYLPPAKAGDCGGCSLFKGPVDADGYCTYFAPVEEE